MFSWFRRKDNPELTPQEWMVVFSTDNLSEAHIVAGRLKSEDIPAWVHQQPGASGFGITIGLFGEVRVLVNAVDYAQALKILDDETPLALDTDNADVRYIFPEDTDATAENPDHDET
jgi:hypothetical protein